MTASFALFDRFHRSRRFRRAHLWLLWLGLGCGGTGEGMEPALGTGGDPALAMPATDENINAAVRPESAAGSSAAGPAVQTMPAAAVSGGSSTTTAAAAGSASAPTLPAANAAAVGVNVAGAAGGGGHDVSAAGSGGAGAPAQQSTGAAGQASQAGAGASPTLDIPLTVFIASDSTASNYKDTGSDEDQAGWGQMLPEFVEPLAKVDNRAIGGRTARRFIDEGRLDEIWSEIQSGDYLLVQFGTNDGNRNATYEIDGQTIPYYLDPATDFKTYVRRYIEGAKEHGAVPVLVTPPPRNSAYCTGGNGTNAHAQALRELGQSDGVTVVDLNMKTVQYLQAICPEPTPPDFFLERADGTVDGTHFQERGARKLASFVAEGLREASVSWVKD